MAESTMKRDQKKTDHIQTIRLAKAIFIEESRLRSRHMVKISS